MSEPTHRLSIELQASMAASTQVMLLSAGEVLVSMCESERHVCLHDSMQVHVEQSSSSGSDTALP